MNTTHREQLQIESDVTNEFNYISYLNAGHNSADKIN